jgi:uncharacterized protein involved in exopolysaccharide biosynthesis
MNAPSTAERHPALLPRLASDLRPHIPLIMLGIIVGSIIGLVAYFSTTSIYEARGSFLINQLPFGLQDDTSTDSETSRQLVQSLILSVSSEGMRREVAKVVGVPDASLAFTDSDRPVSLSGSDKLRANIEITATRNSRLGVVTAQSADPDFAVKVVNAVFTKMEILNQIAGRLEQIEFRLKLNKTEADNLVQEAGSVSADRIKFETQNQVLDSYLAKKNSLENFPAFSTDATLSNLKTQLILVDSDYASLAAQSTGGDMLVGKRGELENLRGQIRDLTEGLANGLRASLQMTDAREASLEKSLNDLEESSAKLETQRTTLAKGFGDFNLPDDLAPQIDPTPAGEASVIVVVDAAYTVPRPVKPVLSIDLVLGAVLGLGIGFGISQVRLQFRPR